MLNTKEVVKVGQPGVIWKMLALALVSFILMIAGASGAQAAQLPQSSNIAVLASTKGAAVDSSTYVGNNDPQITKLVTAINQKTGYSFLKYTVKDGIVTFSNAKYSQLPTNEKREYMETAMVSVQKSGLSTQRKSKMYNFVADQDGPVTAAIRQLKGDTSADFVTAGSWFKPFSGPISVALGMVTIFIFMFLSFSVVLDLAFLVVPFFRAMLERGDGKMSRFVSPEAQSAIRETESAGTGDYKGYLGVYFKRRAISMFIISLCLMWLISGKIYDVVAYFIP